MEIDGDSPRSSQEDDLLDRSTKGTKSAGRQRTKGMVLNRLLNSHLTGICLTARVGTLS